MHFASIKNCDIANGEGVRTSLFVSGCRRHCPFCFNYQTWDFNFGKEYTQEVEDEIVESLSPSYVKGLSLLGGEPFEPENQLELVKLLRRVKKEFPNKTIWCYTGNVLERDLLNKSFYTTEVTLEMLSLIDVLVDGEFVQDLKNISLEFRGSSNQRIIDVKKTLASGEVVLYELKKNTLKW